MAATTGSVHRYEYTYGAGADINRRVDFIRPNATAKNVNVVVQGLFHGQWVELNRLVGNQVIVEMESTTNRFQRMLAQRSGAPVSSPRPDQKLSALSISFQESVLQELGAKQRRLHVENMPGGNYGMETIQALKIIDPR
ncbi:MAG: hypothetical protein KDK71_02500 [Chlamydiia bacterium]|nr:hypothetical protein [Nanoarchaeota archaeon]MCB1115315.1 hypothetical protein [Chlamydiia bacterium]